MQQQQICKLTPHNTNIVVDGFLQSFIRSASIHFHLAPLRQKHSKFLSYSLTLTTLEQECGSIIKHVKQHCVYNFNINTFFQQGIKKPTFIIDCFSQSAIHSGFTPEGLYLNKIRLVDEKRQTTIDEVHYGELEITSDSSYIFHVYDYPHNPLLRRCRTRSFKVHSVGLATYDEPFTLYVEGPILP